MSAVNATTWTISELGNRVALALTVEYAGQANGRVREVPDLRTIRYYTTLGLIDRPRLRGRTAQYGRRHLLQLVAIKRLQAQGLTLADLQQRLLGLPDEALEKLANISVDVEEPSVVEAPEEPAREAFWKQPPVVTVNRQPQAGVVQGLRLTDDVTLLVNTVRTLETEEIEALRVVAAPLLQLLEKRRLVPVPESDPSQRSHP